LAHRGRYGGPRIQAALRSQGAYILLMFLRSETKSARNSLILLVSARESNPGSLVYSVSLNFRALYCPFLKSTTSRAVPTAHRQAGAEGLTPKAAPRREFRSGRAYYRQATAQSPPNCTNRHAPARDRHARGPSKTSGVPMRQIAKPSFDGRATARAQK
jgi:hypothetical protein